MEQSTWLIEGMSCGNCVAAVKRALGALPEVTGVEVELGRAVLRSSAPLPREAVANALENAGFSLRS